MSANVWFEEVNNGLIEEIKNTVKVRDSKGVLVPLIDEAIIIRKPEEDFKSEIYPCISIYNKSYKHEPFRYNPAPIIMEEDKENKVVVLEDPAVPFDLDYQLDLWTKFQTDMDSMTMTWLTKHFRQFNLKVIDDGGKVRSCNCLKKGSVVKSDLVLNGERLFHTIINYRIWVEIDNETRYNKPMVMKTEITTNETQ